MSVIRLARGYTGRSHIIKFEGCYHGHDDALLVKAGSGALTFGHPSSAGVPTETAAHTLVLNFNDVEGLKRTFTELGEQIAAVIVEPVAGNMNLVKATPAFLTELRRLCTHYGSVLIFDEVMTGFRVGLTCAQGMYQIQPDLTVLGKVIGGGMPLAAFGGKKAIMQCLAPVGGVYQAGTLSGNPVSVAAGLATLREIQAEGFYSKLALKTTQLTDGLTAMARKHDVAFCAQAVGGMFGLYFSDTLPQSFSEVMACDKEAFNRFFHAMLKEGIYFAPSAFEAGFVSSAHAEDDISKTLAAADRVFGFW